MSFNIQIVSCKTGDIALDVYNIFGLTIVLVVNRLGSMLNHSSTKEILQVVDL